MDTINNWGIQYVPCRGTYLYADNNFFTVLDSSHMRSSQVEGADVEVYDADRKTWSPYALGPMNKNFPDPFNEYPGIKNKPDPNAWLLEGVREFSRPPLLSPYLQAFTKAVGTFLNRIGGHPPSIESASKAPPPAPKIQN